VPVPMPLPLPENWTKLDELDILEKNQARARARAQAREKNEEDLDTEWLIQNALNWDLNKWAQECASLYPEQLSLLVPQANGEKLQQLFVHLPDTPVESFGKALNASQFLELMRFAGPHQKEHANRKKLSFLFIGLSPTVFKELLAQISQEELVFLREEAITEPVQHLLSQLTNELTGRFNELCNKIETKELEIETTDLQIIGPKEIENLYSQFENFNKEGKNILNLANRALAMAWNANRADLIQELGRIKELCQKCLIDSIGTMGTKENASSGLYQRIDKKVEQLFSDQDSNGNSTPMKDSTPALEALVKFAVWYIHDYVEVGLLPDINAIHSDQENMKSREQLFTAAENNLGKTGLKTLLDLKNARIYSKQALKDYIASFGMQ
jgi:hypothetical protein